VSSITILELDEILSLRAIHNGHKVPLVCI
jgi:hypothetical protein